jgi:hypothetical protein
MGNIMPVKATFYGRSVLSCELRRLSSSHCRRLKEDEAEKSA